MKFRKKLEHNADNYLIAILESIVEYNTVARLDVAKLLYAGYQEAIKDTDKHTSDTLTLEMLSKWMQTLEDLAILCMMFEKPSSSEEKYEQYLYTSNRQILLFLHRAKKGLTQKSLMNIFGLKSAREFYKEGKINKSEIAYFEKAINEETQSHRKTMINIARAYAGNKKRGEKKIEPGILLEIYHKTKHGFHVIHETLTAKKIWDFDNSVIALLTDVKKFKWGRQMLPLTTFKKFKPEETTILLERIQQWSELMGKIAGIQLNLLDDPNFIVYRIRLLKTVDLLKTHPEPDLDQPCLCESGKQYQQCCKPLISENA